MENYEQYLLSQKEKYERDQEQGENAEGLVRCFPGYLMQQYAKPGLHKPGEVARFVGCDLSDGEDEIKIEVKTQASYLISDYCQSNSKEGTIEIELFQEEKPPAGKMNRGWVGMFDPEEYTKLLETSRKPGKAAKPDAFACVLLREGKKKNKIVIEKDIDRYFACLAFEDIDAFYKRLCELSPDPKGWGLLGIREQVQITDTKYWEQYKYTRDNHRWNNNYGTVIGNMWHIPLSSLEDLATVTMINDNPIAEKELAIRQKNSNDKTEISIDTINSRIERLETLAKKHRPSRIYPLKFWSIMGAESWGEIREISTWDELTNFTHEQIKENVPGIIEYGRQVGKYNREHRRETGKDTREWELFKQQFGGIMCETGAKKAVEGK